MWRRIAIFAGILIAIQNLFLFCLGNNGYSNLVILVLNLNSFDDDFFSYVIPKFIFRFFGLIIQKEVKIRKPKIISMIENLDNLKKKSNQSAKKEYGSKNYNLENEIETSPKEKDDNYNYYYTEEKYDQKYFSKSSFGYEIMIFFNLSALYSLFIFLYLFPLRDILFNEVKFNIKRVVEFYRNFMVYFNHLVFATYIYCFIKHYLDVFVNLFTIKDDFIQESIKNLLENSELKKGSEANNSNNKKTEIINFGTLKNMISNISNLVSFLKNLFVFIFLIFYFTFASKVFYQALNIEYKTDIKIVTFERHFSFAFNFSHNFFENFKVLHPYNILSEYQSKYSRFELELKFASLEEKEKKNYVAKRYGISDNNLNMLNLYFSRLDFTMYKSALSDQINQNLYLIILCGKVLERNPVTLDLLKFKTRPETNIIGKIKI